MNVRNSEGNRIRCRMTTETTTKKRKEMREN
jgi:hypothetical protein